MSIPNFPSTGLVPNVTTFQVGDILYMWDGEKWKSITAPLKADQITWKDGSVQDFIDSFALKIFQSPNDGGLTEIQTRTVNANEVYKVRKTSDNSLATIYSDAAGTTEIVQNGTSNVSDSAGVVEFYINAGGYYVEVGVASVNFTVNKDIPSYSEVSKNASGVNVVEAINRSTKPERVFVKYNPSNKHLTIAVLSQYLTLGYERTCTHYNMLKNNDGMFNMHSILVGKALTQVQSGFDATLSGNWSTGSAPLVYARDIGDTAIVDNVYGDSISITRSVDNRGGLFSVGVYRKSTGEIVHSETISCYSSGAGIKSRTTTLSVKLDLDYYRVRFEFLGSDPANPPSDGVPRGWLSSTSTCKSSDSSKLADFDTFKTVMASSVVIFAIRGRVSGSGVATSWVPRHSGQDGVNANVSSKVYVDGFELAGNSETSLPAYFIETQRVSISQTYTAKNYYDQVRAMWKGNISHNFDIDGWKVDHRMTFSNNVDIDSAYLASVAAKNDVFTDCKLISAGSESVFTLSADNSSKNVPAVKNCIFTGGTVEVGRPIYYAMTVEDTFSSVNFGKDYAERADVNALITDRSDGVSKYYHKASSPSTVGAGDVWKVSFSVTAGGGIFPDGADGYF